MSAGRWCAGALCAIAGCGQIDFGVARTDGGTGVGADARTDGPIGPSVARDLTGDGRPDLVVASTTSIHVFAGGPAFAPADVGDATTTLSVTVAGAGLLPRRRHLGGRRGVDAGVFATRRQHQRAEQDQRHPAGVRPRHRSAHGRAPSAPSAPLGWHSRHGSSVRLRRLDHPGGCGLPPGPPTW